MSPDRDREFQSTGTGTKNENLTGTTKIANTGTGIPGTENPGHFLILRFVISPVISSQLTIVSIILLEVLFHAVKPIHYRTIIMTV